MHFKFGKLICWKAVHIEILSKSLAQNHRSFFDMVTFSNWIKQLGRWNIKLMQTIDIPWKMQKLAYNLARLNWSSTRVPMYTFYLYIKSRICCEFYSMWHACCMYVAMEKFLSENSVAFGHCIICIFYHSMGILDFKWPEGK